MIFICFSEMQVEHTAKQYVGSPSTAPWGAPVGVCAPSHRVPLVRLCQHPADTCVCVCVCLFPSQRRPPHNTGLLPAGCPVHVCPNTGLPSPEPSRVHTPGPLCPIRIQATVPQALPPPVCAGLRPWWLHCKGRDNVPCPVDTHPVLAGHSPVCQVRTCRSPTLSTLAVSPSCLVSKCRFRSARQ